MVNNVKPDERSVMAYVSSYYHAFSGAQQVRRLLLPRKYTSYCHAFSEAQRLQYLAVPPKNLKVYMYIVWEVWLVKKICKYYSKNSKKGTGSGPDFFVPNK